MRKFLSALTLVAALWGVAVWTQAQQPAFDVLIRNGRVMDGSGNPWLSADIGIRGGLIAAVGRLGSASAALTIDAADRLVTPGFIDVHSHAAEGLSRPELRQAQPILAQGVTTVVVNPDGGGPVDLRAQRTALETGGIGPNVALLIGHGSVRRAVIGGANRAPTTEELDRMRALVRGGMEHGAFGLSSGLFYTPGSYATTEEVIELARVAGQFGGVYTSHIRDEGTYDFGVVNSVNEVIRIAEEANVRGVVSHMKCLGPDSWGLSAKLVANIDAARARGVEVFADQYPYEASSTSLAAATMPDDGATGAKEAMANPGAREKFLTIVKENIRRRGGAKSIVIASGGGAAGLSGQNLEQIAQTRGVAPEQAAVDIVLAGGASIVSFNMSEDDIETIMRQSWTMGSSDGGLSLPSPNQTHPRSNGAMARRISRYVRERGTVTLEHAVRTMTSLPAKVFGFVDRGEIRPGAFADIVIFDLAKVQDKATYESPHQMAEGFDWVIVNGQISRREGEFTGARGGRVLKRP